MRGEPACGVDNTVAGVITVTLGVAQYTTDKAGVFFTPNQPRDLPIGSNFAKWDFANSGKDFVGEAVVFGVHGW